MHIRTQAGVWTDSTWWDRPSLRETAVCLTLGGSVMAIAELTSVGKADLIFRELNRGLREGAVYFDVADLLEIIGGVPAAEGSDATPEGAARP